MSLKNSENPGSRQTFGRNSVPEEVAVESTFTGAYRMKKDGTLTERLIKDERSKRHGPTVELAGEVSIDRDPCDIAAHDVINVFPAAGGGRVARFLVAENFSCVLEDGHSDAPRSLSDFHNTAPAATKDNAERFIRLLLQLHEVRGDEASYVIKEETLMGSERSAKQYLTVFRTGGDVLPEGLVRKLAMKWKDAWIANTKSVVNSYKVDEQNPDLLEFSRPDTLSERDYLCLGNLTNEVESQAADFAKAYGGKHAEIKIEFDSEDGVVGVGIVKKAPISTGNIRVYKACATLDGIEISKNEVRLRVGSVTGIEPPLHKDQISTNLNNILANIGTREDSNTHTLKREVLSLLGEYHLDVFVKIRESQSMTTGKPIFDLLSIAPEGLFSALENASPDSLGSQEPPECRVPAI